MSSEADEGQKISAFFTGVSKIAGLVGTYKTIKTPTNPKPQSLENFQARKWYWKQEKSISKNMDKNLPQKIKTYKAYKKRNNARTKTRDLMADRKEAQRLMRDEKNMKWKEIIRRKYKKKGLVGDELWDDIYSGSMKSRLAVDNVMIRENVMTLINFMNFLVNQ